MHSLFASVKLSRQFDLLLSLENTKIHHYKHSHLNFLYLTLKSGPIIVLVTLGVPFSSLKTSLILCYSLTPHDFSKMYENSL